MRTQEQLLERLQNHAKEIADIKAKAQEEYKQAVREAAAIRDSKIEAAVRKEKGIIAEYKGTATNVMIQQGRNWHKPVYTAPDQPRTIRGFLITLPDRIFLTPEGLMLEQDYEDRGYTEKSRRLVEWADLLHWRAGNLEALPKWDTPYTRISALRSMVKAIKTKTVNT